MNNLNSVEPIITDSKLKPIFFVTWEVTLKCNLDCSYCGDTGHNNSLPHPTLEECKRTIDFMMPYLDLYMEKRKNDQRHVSLNIFGGESLFHPDIVDILDYCNEKYQPYSNKWSLDLNTVTNALVKQKVWDRIVDKINYWTVSFHSESTKKQRDLVKSNILDLKKRNKNFHVAVMMHPRFWDISMDIIEWCKDHEIKYLPRQIDHNWHQFQFYYKPEQADWLRNQYNHSGCNGCAKKKISPSKIIKDTLIKAVNLSDEGRQCCGGRPLHVDGQYNDTQTHVNNKFKGWACGVDHFFLFIKQTTKQIFTNKDCQMNFNNSVGPIGNLDECEKLLEKTKDRLAQDIPPAIICKKKSCLCGICAPKAKNIKDYNNIIKTYVE